MSFDTTLGILAAIVTIGVGVGTTVYFIVKQEDRRTARRVVGVTSIMVIIIVAVAGAFALSQPGGTAGSLSNQTANNGGGSLPKATTALPTATATDISATATKTPPAPYVLCQAGGQYGWQGWDIGGSWKVLNGDLLNDGTSSTSNYSPNLVPPASCQPPTPDYLVELAAQITQAEVATFGIDVRGHYVGTFQYGPVFGGQVTFGLTDDVNQALDRSSTGVATVGTDYHTYAVEVQGNTLSILFDGGIQVQGTDNRYLDPGQIGLWSNNLQFQVSSFKVTILP